MNETTKRFSRSTRDAFDVERFPAVEKYTSPIAERVYGIVLVVIASIILSALLMHFLSK